MENSKAAPKIGAIILEKSEDWDQWFRDLKASVSEEFWPLADPDSLRLPSNLPLKPLYQDVNRTAGSFLAFTAPQQKTYEGLMRIYSEEHKIYTREQAALAAIRVRIQETVPLSKRVDLQPTDTVKEWLKTLRTAIRPSTGYLMAMAKEKYDSLFKLRIKPLEWLSRWEIAIASIKQYDLSEFKEGVWLHNLAAWIRPHAPELSLMLKTKANDASTNSLSNYPAIIREVREHLRDGTRERTVRGNAYAAILNDEEDDGVEVVASHASKRQRANTMGESRSTNRQSKRPCRACEKKGHEIQSCWYIFPETAPESFVISDVMQQKLSDRIKKDSKLKKKINQLKKEKEKASDKTPEKDEAVA